MRLRRSRLSRAFLAVVLTLAAVLIMLSPVAAAAAPLELFTRPGCPHCADARSWVDALAKRRPEVEIVIRDVVADPAALRDLDQIVRLQGLGAAALPTFRVGEHVVIGFDDAESTGPRVEALLDGGGEDAGSRGPTCSTEIDATCVEPPTANEDVIDVPWLGRLSARSLGLPAFTIVVGLIDGFNPCAMWVLMFLLALLVNVQSRARMLAIAGTFVVVSGLAYYAFMAAWLNVFQLIGFSRAVQIVLGCLALAVGAVNVKDFFAFGKGISLSIPESAKPGIYARVRAIVRAETIVAAIAGATVLAVLVNVIELLCTAGLPALYTQVLVQQGVGKSARYAYLALYAVAYMLDDAIMVGIAVVTLWRRKLQERTGRWLKLLSGATILILGLLLLFAPQALVW